MRQYLHPRNLLFLSFIGGFIMGWLAHLSRAELLLTGMHNFLQVLSLMGFGTCAFLLWFRFRAEIPRLPMTNFKFIGILLVTLLMFAVNFNLLFQYTARLLGAAAKDVYPIACILCGPALGLFTRKERLIFGAVLAIFLVLAVFTASKVNVNVVTMAADRSMAFEELGAKALYSFQIAISMTSALLLLYLLPTLRSFWVTSICSFGMLFWLYTSLLYSKRQGLMEFVIVGGVLGCFLLFGKQIKRARPYLLAGSILLVIGAGVVAMRTTAIGVMYERVIQRFQGIQYEGIGNFDRIQESLAYFENTGMVEIIFGKGIGGVSFDIVSMYTIHMGWVNLVFKGGVFLPLLFAIALVWNIVYVLLQRGFPNKFLVIFFSAYLMFRLLYSPAWGFLPSGILLGLSFFAPEIFLASQRQAKIGSRPGGAINHNPHGGVHPNRVAYASLRR